MLKYCLTCRGLQKHDTAEGSPQASERKTPAMSGGGGNVANLVKRISTELQSKSEVPVRAGSSDVKQRRVKAAFSYTPQNEDELRLDVDDVVEVLGEEEEGWWKGRLKGRVGVFPANFVKPLDQSSWPESRHDSEEKPKSEESGEGNNSGSSSVEIQPKKVAGVGFGNIFAANQKIELRNVKPAVGGSPASAATTIVSEATKKLADVPITVTAKDSVQKGAVTNGKRPLPTPASADMLSGQKQKEYAKALFAYDAENDDELSLQEGDVMMIISKEVEDAGWWLGELNGKRGVFPDNFVTLISTEEAEKAKKTTLPSSGVASVVIPPTVPAKPPKPGSTTTPASSEIGKVAPSMQDGKQDVPFVGSKHAVENHPKGEIYGGEKGTAPSSVTSEKDKLSMYKKPLVPLVGMAKPNKPFSGGRLISGSGASSPNHPDGDADGETDGVNSSDPDKLNHPTASRARNPNRRPPSQAFLKDMAVEPSLVTSTISTAADDSPILPKNPSGSSSSFEVVSNNGKFRSDSTGEEHVRREEFDKLQAAFESFKRETRERIRELEKLVASSQTGRSQKL